MLQKIRQLSEGSVDSGLEMASIDGRYDTTLLLYSGAPSNVGHAQVQSKAFISPGSFVRLLSSAERCAAIMGYPGRV